MYQQEDLLPSNRNYFLFLGCFTIFFTLGLTYFVISQYTKPEEKPIIVVKDKTTTPSADLTKYNQDSDNDLIPNFVEEEVILNTYIPETFYCEAANPLCSDKTFKSDNYVAIILDSSTSMNIPAQGDLSKLEGVKTATEDFLNDSFFDKYIKTEIVGFGNKGNVSFIADNESCVSSLTFKKFDQELKPGFGDKVLTNFVANGKSPVSYTIEQIEKTFPDKNAKNYIFLITDGGDDCGGDLAYTVSQVLSRGVVKKINILSYFAPQDERAKLREIAESNGGSFSDSKEISRTLLAWKKDFVLANWCKYQDQNLVYQCLDKNYQIAYNFLETLTSEATPLNEISKIREIRSSADLLIQNYKNLKNEELKKEFEEVYTKNRIIKD